MILNFEAVSGDCVVSSEGVLLGDKISIKHSCIGQHCSVGDKTKLLNCVIMDHVQIGEGYNNYKTFLCREPSKR